jgi:Na+-translocating ferredoxin:NAD+ oxidoreductase RnfA subunit
MAYFLIIMFGFLFSIRGVRGLDPQSPAPGFFRLWREAADFLLTLSLLLAVLTLGLSADVTRPFVREYALLVVGLPAYLLTRYQGKNDIFFLSVSVLAFMIVSVQDDLMNGLSWAWVLGSGIVLFQVVFFGLRFKLLFSKVPQSIKGWPILCLLASFIALALWALAQRLF